MGHSGKNSKGINIKYTLVLFIIAVLSLNCSLLHHEEVVQLDESYIIVDVRSAKEYKGGHLRNAINIPYTKIGDRIGDYVKDTDQKIALYCRSGRRSSIAQRTLVKKGYTHVINAGTYSELKEQEKSME